MRTTEKAKILLGAAFLLPVCVHLSPRSPRLPLGASQHLFYWLLLCVREQIVFYSQVRVEDECVWVPLLFVSGWNYLSAKCVGRRLSAFDAGPCVPAQRARPLVTKRELCLLVST